MAVSAAPVQLPRRCGGPNVDARDSSAKWAWTVRHFAGMAGIGVLIGAWRAEALPDTDVYWGARAGLETLRSGQIPGTDHYSWTAHGAQWISNSWAWNVVLGMAYGTAGFFGFAVLTLLIGAVAGLTVARFARWAGAPPVQSMMVFAGLGSAILVSSPRAAVVSTLAVTLIPPLLGEIASGVLRRVTPAALKLFALQVAWMNLHSGAVIGPVIIAVGGAGYLASFRRDAHISGRRICGLGATVLLAAAGCAVTPSGWGGMTHVLAVREASAGLIAEWMPPGLGSVMQVLGLLAIPVALSAMYVAWRWRRLDLVAVVLVVGIASVSAVRFMPMVVILGSPMLSDVLGRLNVRPHMARRIVACGCAAIAVVAVAKLPTAPTRQRDLASTDLIARLPTGCRLVNDYDVGGAVILLRPDVQVSVDGRNDIYGRAALMRVVGWIDDAPGTRSALLTNRVDCVLAPTATPIVRSLSQDPRWSLIGSDGARSLLVRQGTQPR